MKNISFTLAEKAKLFDRIAEQYYHMNFGRMTKADMELMMFQFYIEKLIEMNKADDGTIDYNKCSDYIISKELGITQQRVRSLKIKNQLVHPKDFDWQAALATQIHNARYDKTTQRITLNIPDPNLYLEIQNFLEEKGAHIEKQLNNKILQMRAEYFIELAIVLEPEKSKRNVIRELQKTLKDANKNDSAFDEKEVAKEILSAAIDISTIAANLASVFSSGNAIASALCGLLSK